MMWASRDHAPTTSGPARQEVFCAFCDGPATPDDFSYVVREVVCPTCLKRWQETAEIESAIAQQQLESQP
jgi:recombinational DNA repair protein (RecF pathway)